MFARYDGSSKPGASALWIALLTATSTATTYVLACATPFPALAALAALHMRERDGLALMALAWIASQIVGFGLLGYPHSSTTVAWGLALAVAALVSAGAAYLLLPRLRLRSMWSRLAAAYVVAFLAFKAAIALCGLALGDLASAFDPAIVLAQFMRNGAILLGLFLLYHGLVALGVPAARGGLATA